ncbi:bifunctional DNA primase/polymerase [Streptomyces sp. NBC_01362]|uniref:bifunctional DNA primase/polymerase n=1 Tax=Streptomyces sp. NBC_01362 TaxID=2903839 RepID=UPI002E2EB690|nr:bifunctional DNA primase/polymerase [Streptomyces sp. NBC_01362]
MTHEARSALLSAALDAAARGWAVFPLRPGGKPPALHGEASCPGTGDCTTGHRKWEQRATTDPDRIHRAWSTGRFNIGVATGPSGLIVVDLDMPKPTDPKGTPDGATSFQALCERAGQAFPTTYRVRTASGGHHLYFTAPDGDQLPSSKGKLAPKIDTRAWGGYVVAPGSVVNGHAYEVTDPAPVADLPAWLLQALTAKPAPAQPVRIQAPRFGNRAADAALERETATVRATTEGGRNEQLLKSARAVGRFVAWGDLPRHAVEDAFQAAGESTGLPAAECRTTIRSALNWSIRTCRPRGTAA